ncbi:MAG: iron complex transport system substrate-binding protein [Thermoanaerobaculia bacterium]|nr:iron complex transport system substrate-binding protein [Thermoanaerobaculia bacterium]
MVEFLRLRVNRGIVTRRRGDAEKSGMHELDEITGTIIDSAIQVHRSLGPGLLESVYELVLARVLMERGFKIERQKILSFEYEGLLFANAFRIDLLVDDRVIVEIKSVEELAPVHSKQLLTYLRLSDLQVGLLINFGSATLKEGLRRIVNHLPPSASPRLRVNRLS